MAKELRDLSDQELYQELDQISKDLFALRNQLSLERRVEAPHLLKEKRHKRARILTILRERNTSLRA